MNEITVAARISPLSQAQVKEIEAEITKASIPVALKVSYLHSMGDKDLKTSLRTLGKSDFFTKELDEMVLSGQCRIAIHSAKDLPDPLPKGLKIVALTKGLDPSDSLVMPEGFTFANLPKDAIIATSSERREEAVKQLRSDLTFIDLRGTIGERLEKLEKGEAHGVVVAEAALIRLKLTRLNRITLPGETVPYQGQLAIVGREEDGEIREWFAPLDVRPTLCLGLEVPNRYRNRFIEHHPIIKIEPVPIDTKVLRDWSSCTHIIFTSKAAVDQFFSHVKKIDLCVIALGKATAQRIESYGVNVDCIASEETAEGVVETLAALNIKEEKTVKVFWPHSALSRPVLRDYFEANQIAYVECILYNTIPKYIDVCLERYAEIIFTSSSTVDAFLEVFGKFPQHVWLTPLGPITREKLFSQNITRRV